MASKIIFAFAAPLQCIVSCIVLLVILATDRLCTDIIVELVHSYLLALQSHNLEVLPAMPM